MWPSFDPLLAHQGLLYATHSDRTILFVLDLAHFFGDFNPFLFLLPFIRNLNRIERLLVVKTRHERADIGFTELKDVCEAPVTEVVASG